MWLKFSYQNNIHSDQIHHVPSFKLCCLDQLWTIGSIIPRWLINNNEFWDKDDSFWQIFIALACFNYKTEMINPVFIQTLDIKHWQWAIACFDMWPFGWIEFSTKWLWVHGWLVLMYIYTHHTNAGLTTSVPHVKHFLHSNDAIHSQLSLIIFHLYSFMVVSSAAFVNNWMWSCGHKYHK